MGMPDAPGKATGAVSIYKGWKPMESTQVQYAGRTWEIVAEQHSVVVLRDVESGELITVSQAEAGQENY
jgi:hypothetical protein